MAEEDIDGFQELPTGDHFFQSHSNISLQPPHTISVPRTTRSTTRKRTSYSDISSFFVPLLGFSLFITCFLRISLQSLDDEVSLLLSNRGISDKQIQGFEKYVRGLQESLVLDTEHEDPKANPEEEGKAAHAGYRFYDEHGNSMVDVDTLRSEIKTLRKSSKNLKVLVQEYSKEEAIRKYGQGGHRVEVELTFPNNLEGPNTFIIELAPVNLMPHSVLFFLDMVSLGLLDGCSFITNALHTLKEAPISFDGSSTREKARSYARHGLESVTFKEYSKHYPHKLYTVGFAADGSPSFYINTRENDELHVGEPCFGRIVSGFDAVRRLEESPVRQGIWLRDRVGIKRARILADKRAA